MLPSLFQKRSKGGGSSTVCGTNTSRWNFRLGTDVGLPVEKNIGATLAEEKQANYSSR